MKLENLILEVNLLSDLVHFVLANWDFVSSHFMSQSSRVQELEEELEYLRERLAHKRRRKILVRDKSLGIAARLLVGYDLYGALREVVEKIGRRETPSSEEITRVLFAAFNRWIRISLIGLALILLPAGFNAANLFLLSKQNAIAREALEERIKTEISRAEGEKIASLVVAEHQLFELMSYVGEVLNTNMYNRIPYPHDDFLDRIRQEKANVILNIKLLVYFPGISQELINVLKSLESLEEAPPDRYLFSDDAPYEERFRNELEGDSEELPAFDERQSSRSKGDIYYDYFHELQDDLSRAFYQIETALRKLRPERGG